MPLPRRVPRKKFTFIWTITSPRQSGAAVKSTAMPGGGILISTLPTGPAVFLIWLITYVLGTEYSAAADASNRVHRGMH
jgi:hypothetical protein